MIKLADSSNISIGSKGIEPIIKTITFKLIAI
jgi:hypothetical protein